MAFEVVETHELIKTIEHFPEVPNYWLNTFFPNAHFSQTEYIDFDIVDSGRQLAPFVAPNVQGQPMVARGYSTKKFKPAYIKPKTALDPNRLMRRRAGEAFGGTMSLQEREDAIIADTMMEHKKAIERRFEWMACKAISDGAITIGGDNYPTVTLSFGREATNTKTLASTFGWNEATGVPLTDIAGWKTEMHLLCGYAFDRITFTPTAWDDFITNPQVVAMQETRRGSSMSIESTPTGGVPYRYAGNLPDGTELWVYYDVYEDNQGTLVPFLADGNIVLTNSAVDGLRCFGAIIDKKANYASVPMFVKMWEQEDPSGLFLMTQSAPLMIPCRPNATMKVDVHYG